MKAEVNTIFLVNESSCGLRDNLLDQLDMACGWDQTIGNATDTGNCRKHD